MDKRLFESAESGRVELLHQLLRGNPLLLHTISLTRPDYNPAHVASACGNVDFVKEIIRLKPEFIRELSQDGYSPMHIASANGHVEIVKEIMRYDHTLGRLQGKDRKTPLHCAAAKGKLGVITQILIACSGECIDDVTVQGETALHLAARNNQSEAILVLVERIREMKMFHVLNMKDEGGNTILHVAVWRKQREVIKLLLHDDHIKGQIEINDINLSGLTALDVLTILPSEAGDREIEEIFKNAGAKRAREFHFTTPPSTEPNHQMETQNPPPHTRLSLEKDLVEYFKFKRGRDSPSEARSALLVIAVLVATATFQVGLSPPGGVWEDSGFAIESKNTTSTTFHYAGRSILGSFSEISFTLFVIFNSIGLSMSLLIINILTSNFPLQMELQICMVAMFFTYNTSVVTIAPEGIRLQLIIFTSVLPTALRVLVALGRNCFRRLTGPLTNLLSKVSRALKLCSSTSQL